VHAGPGGKQIRQFGADFRAQGDQIYRLAPCRRLVGTAGRHQLGYQGRQDGVRMLVPDQVEALEGLVYEINRVSPVGERACPP
jgi:hypothetical protein